MPRKLTDPGYAKLSRLADWKTRHLTSLLLAVVTVYLFWLARAEWSDMHRWNRAFGDASVVLVAAAMMIGPVARLWSKLRKLNPWRRELGIWGVILGLVHTAVILFGWVNWDFARLFGYEFHPQLERYVMLQQGFGLANILGIAALLYGVSLALMSNNFSQRFLGGSVWKFFQQGTYVLWMLIVVHTFYFLFLHFQHFDRSVPEPNWARWPFIILVLVIMSLQGAASWKAWRGTRGNRGRRDGSHLDRQLNNI